MKLPYAGAIDCDIHPSVPSTAVLMPYLEPVWQSTVGMIIRGIEHMDLTSYPPNSNLACRPDWRPAAGKPAVSLEAVQTQALDHFGLQFAICNFIHGAQILTNGDLGGVLCRALNDWIAREWLDRDPRLRASIVVSLQNPDFAAEEVERLAHDKRFVQVLLLSMGELPLGRRYYWPLYKAAEKHGLPIGVHAGSMFRVAPTQSGFPSYLVEDYCTQSQAMGSQLASFVAEGVFVKFPGLRLVLIESGVTWLPSMMWRFGKDWRGTRTEVPWINTPPPAIIREHLRLTLQPFDAPPGAKDIERFFDHVGSDEVVLFSSDYPHHQFDGDEALPDGLPESMLRKILIDNPLNAYPRLRETLS